MSNVSWGSSVWIFFHTLVAKIKPQHFLEHREKLVDIIIQVCANLPCPECTAHASDFLRTVRFQNVGRKEDLVEIMHVFHNQVNKNLGKPEFKRTDAHDNNDMGVVVAAFIKAYNARVPSALMAHAFNRRNMCNRIHSFLAANKSAFDV